MIRLLLTFVIAISCNIAAAQVVVTSRCFAYQPKQPTKASFSLFLHTYYDNKLKKEVGSFVQYKKDDYIPLVFEERIETDVDSPDLGNFELHWLEITGRKITGEYIFTRTGAGIRQGEYLEYKSFKNGKSLVFFEVMAPDTCIEVCVKNRCRIQFQASRRLQFLLVFAATDPARTI